MVKYCHICGKENNGWKFCPDCGTEFNEEQPVTLEAALRRALEKPENKKRYQSDNEQQDTQSSSFDYSKPKTYFEDFLRPVDDSCAKNYTTSKNDLDDFEYTKHSDGTITITGVKDKNITSIKIPDNVVAIGERVFEDCTNLQSVTIGKGVTIIGDEAFLRCCSLISINIPNSVTSIGDSAFLGCSRLTSINIPDSVIAIGDSAFCGCESLIRINIPNNITSIGDDMFHWCFNLVSVKVLNSVTSIGKSAFSECRRLASINIPNGVTNIGHDAFYLCSSLTTIDIPDSVTSIGSYAFAGSGLKTIYIGKQNGISDITLKEDCLQDSWLSPANCEIIRK